MSFFPVGLVKFALAHYREDVSAIYLLLSAIYFSAKLSANSHDFSSSDRTRSCLCLFVPNSQNTWRLWCFLLFLSSLSPCPHSSLYTHIFPPTRATLGKHTRVLSIDFICNRAASKSCFAFSLNTQNRLRLVKGGVSCAVGYRDKSPLHQFVFLCMLLYRLAELLHNLSILPRSNCRSTTWVQLPSLYYANSLQSSPNMLLPLSLYFLSPYLCFPYPHTPI